MISLPVPCNAVSRAIGEIVRDEIQWPNVNFIPQDPMRLVLYQLDTVGLFFDNMEIESIFRSTENLVGRRLKRKEWERICEMTFGEAVDFLLQIKNESHPTGPLDEVLHGE